MAQNRPDQVFIIYDDHCSMCTMFARCAGRLSGGSLVLVGHYSRRGERMRRELLGSGALEMFWLVDRDAAYGGRAAIGPLLKYIAAGWSAGGLRRRRGSRGPGAVADAADGPASCASSDCSGPADVFIRSASLIRNSRIIRVDGGSGARGGDKTK